MNSLRLGALGLMVVLAAAACDNGSSATTTTPAPPTVTETLIGTVAAVANGVQQTSFVPFTVAQAGTVSVTLTSAVETFPGGALNPSVIVGLSIGTGNASGTACTLSSGNVPLLVSAGPSSYSVSLVAGPACVQVSDQTVQTGPVAYTLVIVHP
jgi:peptidoglycan/LPS O-acetylase OafA/YrhL